MLWWMTVSSNGYLKSHHAVKQEALPYRRWGSSHQPRYQLVNYLPPIEVAGSQAFNSHAGRLTASRRLATQKVRSPALKINEVK
jgi:hypothetical protein